MRYCMYTSSILGLDQCVPPRRYRQGYPTIMLFLSAALWIVGAFLWFISWDICARTERRYLWSWTHVFPPLMFFMSTVMYIGFRPIHDTRDTHDSESDRPTLINLAVWTVSFVGLGIGLYLLFMDPTAIVTDKYVLHITSHPDNGDHGPATTTTTLSAAQLEAYEAAEQRLREDQDVWDQIFLPRLFALVCWMLSLWFNRLWRVRRVQQLSGHNGAAT